MIAVATLGFSGCQGVSPDSSEGVDTVGHTLRSTIDREAQLPTAALVLGADPTVALALGTRVYSYWPAVRGLQEYEADVLSLALAPATVKRHETFAVTLTTQSKPTYWEVRLFATDPRRDDSTNPVLEVSCSSAEANAICAERISESAIRTWNGQIPPDTRWVIFYSEWLVSDNAPSDLAQHAAASWLFEVAVE